MKIIINSLRFVLKGKNLNRFSLKTFFLSIIFLSSCQENRVLIDEIVEKGFITDKTYFYQSKLYNGVVFDFYEYSNQIHYENKIRKGKLVESKYWHKNGQLSSEIFYKKHNGIEDKIKSSKRWYNDGKIEYEFLSNNEIEYTKSWYQNGQLKSQTNITYEMIPFTNENYPNGKFERCKSDFSQGWYENGQKQYEEKVVCDSLVDGLKKSWYENGNLEYKVKFSKGKRDGLVTHFHHNGKKYWEVFYINGKESGFEKWWDENGILRQKVLYNDGVKVQDRIYYANGNISSIENFYDGLSLNRVGYDLNGNKLFNEEYVNGKLKNQIIY